MLDKLEELELLDLQVRKIIQNEYSMQCKGQSLETRESYAKLILIMKLYTAEHETLVESC